MKTYQTPEIVWQILDPADIITASTTFVNGSGSDNTNVISWWL